MEPCGGKDNVKSNDKNLQASDSKPDVLKDSPSPSPLEQPAEASATLHEAARSSREMAGNSGFHFLDDGGRLLLGVIICKRVRTSY